MSVVSRILVAGLACASLAGAARAQTASAGGDDQNKGARERLFHASGCLVTFGFACHDGAAKADKGGDKGAGQPAVTKASVVTGGDDQSAGTRTRFLHASKCVVSLGLLSSCDKDAPAEAAKRADAAPAAPDTSTRGRFFQAARCVGSLGLVGDCDKK